jgi:hypothetical protein
MAERLRSIRGVRQSPRFGPAHGAKPFIAGLAIKEELMVAFNEN